MRITTQMLAETSRKSGIPLQSSSLLDYINKDSQTAISNIGNNVNTPTALKKNGYSKLQDISEELSKDANTLTATDKDSLFSKATESKDTKEIVEAVINLTEEYNAVLKQLQSVGGTMNNFYLQQLKQLPSSSQEELQSIGITQAKDGNLTVDEKLLQSTDVETLKTLFSGDSGFAAKLGYVSGRINENAAANIASVSNQYSANGTASTNSFESSKYNFLG